jgi:hypothetical protein
VNLNFFEVLINVLLGKIKGESLCLQILNVTVVLFSMVKSLFALNACSVLSVAVR